MNRLEISFLNEPELIFYTQLNSSDYCYLTLIILFDVNINT